MKNINLTEDQFYYLLSVCQNNRVEVSGSFKTKSINGNVFIYDIRFDSPNETIERSAKIVNIGYNVLSNRILNTIYKDREDYIINFHTHPDSELLPLPSKDDIGFIKHFQQVVSQSANNLKRNGYLNINVFPKYLECIIHPNSLAFFYYNDKTNKIEKANVFVNGRKYDAGENKTISTIYHNFIEKHRKNK